MILRRLQAEGFKHLRGIDLVFPPKGTFLIQGSNEAGKSSLFEVVFFGLFGKPLQAPRIEDLIGYGLNEAKIYLEVELPANDLKIERIIRRNRANAIKLVIGEEVITTLKEANRRIQGELHLDADTLLNSCFVEQKALEKLEGLDKSARESAVMKLLNLERMQAIEEELKVKREDERRLEEWEKKKRIAEIREEIPSLKKEIEHYERLRGFQEVKALLGEAETYKKLAVEEEKKLPSLEQKRNELQKKMQEFNRVKEKEHKVDNLLSALRFLREKEAHLDSLNKELEKVGEAKMLLPNLRKRREKAEECLDLCEELKARQLEIESLDRRLELERQVREEENQIAVLEASLKAKTEEMDKRKEKIELLRQWSEVKEKEEKIKQREKLSEEAGRLKTQGVVSLIFAIILFPLLFLFAPIKLFSLISLLPLICAIFAFKKRGDILIKLAGLGAEIGAIDVKPLRAKLEEKGLIDIEDRELIGALLQKEEEELRVLEQDVARLRNTISISEGKLETLRNLMTSDFPSSLAGLSAEELRKRREEISDTLGKRKGELENVAKEYELPLEEEKLKEMKIRLDNEIKYAEELVKAEERLLREKEADEREISNLTEEIKKGAGLFEEVQEVFSREEWEKVKAELKKVRDQLEREEVERKLQEAIGQLRTQEERVRNYKARAEELEGQAKEKLSELGTPPEDLPPLEEITKALDEKRAELLRVEKEMETLLEQIVGDIPPLEECKAEYERLARELKVRNLSAAILETARRNITRKILPRTIEHMWSILPLITNDRYRQVTLDEESFKIRVYDERAGDWKDKQIFSGGTRDQMSLALRLAFALAALPQERGTAPRFLFLDEPLSSFDEQRREALIKVITQGEIAEAFDQIFVISHTPLLNPNLFHYYILMENGKIKECSEELVPPERKSIPFPTT